MRKIVAICLFAALFFGFVLNAAAEIDLYPDDRSENNGIVIEGDSEDTPAETPAENQDGIILEGDEPQGGNPLAQTSPMPQPTPLQVPGTIKFEPSEGLLYREKLGWNYVRFIDAWEDQDYRYLKVKGYTQPGQENGFTVDGLPNVRMFLSTGYAGKYDVYLNVPTWDNRRNALWYQGGEGNAIPIEDDIWKFPKQQEPYRSKPLKPLLIGSGDGKRKQMILPVYYDGKLSAGKKTLPKSGIDYGRFDAKANAMIYREMPYISFFPFVHGKYTFKLEGLFRKFEDGRKEFVPIDMEKTGTITCEAQYTNVDEKITASKDVVFSKDNQYTVTLDGFSSIPISLMAKKAEYDAIYFQPHQYHETAQEEFFFFSVTAPTRRLRIENESDSMQDPLLDSLFPQKLLLGIHKTYPKETEENPVFVSCTKNFLTNNDVKVNVNNGKYLDVSIPISFVMRQEESFTLSFRKLSNIEFDATGLRDDRFTVRYVKEPKGAYVSHKLIFTPLDPKPMPEYDAREEYHMGTLRVRTTSNWIGVKVEKTPNSLFLYDGEKGVNTYFASENGDAPYVLKAIEYKSGEIGYNLTVWTGKKPYTSFVLYDRLNAVQPLYPKQLLHYMGGEIPQGIEAFGSTKIDPGKLGEDPSWKPLDTLQERIYSVAYRFHEVGQKSQIYLRTNTPTYNRAEIEVIRDGGAESYFSDVMGTPNPYRSVAEVIFHGGNTPVEIAYLPEQVTQEKLTSSIYPMEGDKAWLGGASGKYGFGELPKDVSKIVFDGTTLYDKASGWLQKEFFLWPEKLGEDSFSRLEIFYDQSQAQDGYFATTPPRHNRFDWYAIFSE